MSDASHGKAGRLGSKGNDTEFEVRPSFDEMEKHCKGQASAETAVAA